ncbi:site-specific integrase [Anaerospora hongkongensis]|uniref:tyrosine-type recombinase/integrase n=1 Tax=Anaerospora hongkongensis TaxID=244830 RepID=UPI002FDB578B
MAESYFKRERKNKDGSITPFWVVEFTDATGKTKSFSGKLKKNVQAKLDKYKADVLLDVYVEPSAMTLSEWVKHWLSTYKKPSLRPTTFNTYRTLLKAHITAKLGDKKLQEVSTDDLQRLVVDMNVSPRTLKDIFAILKSCLAKAIEKNYIRVNPVNGIELPKVGKKERAVLSIEQSIEFRENEKNKKHPLYAAFMLQLLTGIRRGEVLGLRVQDIDFKNNLIHIWQNAVSVQGQGVVIQLPKTKASIRSIPMTKELRTILENHKQIPNKLKLFFCSEKGTPIIPRNYQRTFETIFAKDYEGITLHSLRRTFATHMCANGVDMSTTAKIMGHTDIRMIAEIYNQPQFDTLLAAMQKYEIALQNPQNTETEPTDEDTEKS